MPYFVRRNRCAVAGLPRPVAYPGDYILEKIVKILDDAYDHLPVIYSGAAVHP